MKVQLQWWMAPSMLLLSINQFVTGSVMLVQSKEGRKNEDPTGLLVAGIVNIILGGVILMLAILLFVLCLQDEE